MQGKELGGGEGHQEELLGLPLASLHTFSLCNFAHLTLPCPGPPDFLFSAAFGFVCCPQKPELSFCYTALPRHAPYNMRPPATVINLYCKWASFFNPVAAAPHNILFKASFVFSIIFFLCEGSPASKNAGSIWALPK